MFFTPHQDVARGAKFLDEKFPGWDQKIDLVALDINRPTTCALAQASGKMFWSAFDEVGLTRSQAYRLGFLNKKCQRFPALTYAWRQLILARRIAAAA